MRTGAAAGLLGGNATAVAAARAAAGGGASGVDRRFAEALMKSIGVIGASEVGDKTFFIAAIMAMRHPRLTVRPRRRAPQRGATQQQAAARPQRGRAGANGACPSPSPTPTPHTHVRRRSLAAPSPRWR
jgi:hypothetical protein